ncbi:MAG: HU family DNA-binding protein [Aquificota bacterium]|nr:HU family DNA-binding protein [Aquificota bacterium]
MKKSDISREIARRKGIPQRKARTIVDQVFSIMAEALTRGEKIEIRGLGTFRVRKRPSRFVKDPRTGVEIFVKERYVPTFKMGKIMKNSLNSKG